MHLEGSSIIRRHRRRGFHCARGTRALTRIMLALHRCKENRSRTWADAATARRPNKQAIWSIGMPTGPAPIAWQCRCCICLSASWRGGAPPCFIAGGGSVLLDQRNRCLPASFHAVPFRDSLSRASGRCPGGAQLHAWSTHARHVPCAHRTPRTIYYRASGPWATQHWVATRAGAAVTRFDEAWLEVIRHRTVWPSLSLTSLAESSPRECAASLSLTVWPSGLRRWLQAPVRKGVGSNPTAVTFDYFASGGSDRSSNDGTPNRTSLMFSRAKDRRHMDGVGWGTRGFQPRPTQQLTRGPAPSAWPHPFGELPPPPPHPPIPMPLPLRRLPPGKHRGEGARIHVCPKAATHSELKASMCQVPLVQRYSTCLLF